MNAEIEREKTKIIAEWQQRAENDLESAGIILRESDNYDIAIYHSHQAIEKLLKAILLKQGQTFKFSHDISALFLQAFKDSSQDKRFDSTSKGNYSIGRVIVNVVPCPTADSTLILPLCSSMTL